MPMNKEVLVQILPFFEIARAGHTYTGNQSISQTSLRVPDDEALAYWLDRFRQFKVNHEGMGEQFGRKVIRFRDHENQRLVLVSDQTNQGVASGIPWTNSAVPQDKAITGLGPVQLTVPDISPTARVLTELLGFRQVGSYPSRNKGMPDVEVFSTGEGGTGAELHVELSSDLQKERPGRGSVHHVALRVDNRAELEKWHEKNSKGTTTKLRIGGSILFSILILSRAKWYFNRVGYRRTRVCYR